MPKANPKLHDKEWLYEEYVVKQRTYEDIAKDANATKHGVYHAMQRYGFKARVHSSKYPQLNDKEWLRKKYIDEKLSTKQIADLLGTTVGNIHSALTHSGVETRGYKEGLSTRFPDGRTGKDHPYWKGGRPSCVDCGRELVDYDALRCLVCERVENRKGSKNKNWRGGITPINALIRSSKEMKAWRLSVFERDNYTCVKCNARSGNGKAVILHADHIKSFSEYPALRFDINNGRTLCIDCHKQTPNYAGKLNKGKKYKVHKI